MQLTQATALLCLLLSHHTRKLVAVIRNMLTEGLSDSAGANFADLMLRLYGVPAFEAASLARHPYRLTLFPHFSLQHSSSATPRNEKKRFRPGTD